MASGYLDIIFTNELLFYREALYCYNTTVPHVFSQTVCCLYWPHRWVGIVFTSKTVKLVISLMLLPMMPYVIVRMTIFSSLATERCCNIMGSMYNPKCHPYLEEMLVITLHHGNMRPPLYLPTMDPITHWVCFLLHMTPQTFTSHKSYHTLATPVIVCPQRRV